LERLRGTGGFGEVWFARHARMGSLSGAVKFCFGQSGRDLIHEADLIDRVMRAGTHPNIVPLKDAHLEGACPWLLFEYVAGGTLTDWIHQLAGKPKEQRLTQASAALKQLCEAVGFFHALPVPIVHRDLKPSNILLDRATGRLRITDFGIGSITANETNRTESRGHGTRGGRLLSYLRGSHTPLYSSPQQRSGEDADPRDDVHALGVIAYQMLTGHLAQGAGPDFADDLRDAGASEELIALLGKCVAQKPERRPKDAGEVLRLLPSPQAGVGLGMRVTEHQVPAGVGDTPNTPHPSPATPPPTSPARGEVKSATGGEPSETNSQAPTSPLAGEVDPASAASGARGGIKPAAAPLFAAPPIDSEEEQLRRDIEEYEQALTRGYGTKPFLEVHAPKRFRAWLEAANRGNVAIAA
jgi:serine/threonine protein kinase